MPLVRCRRGLWRSRRYCGFAPAAATLTTMHFTLLPLWGVLDFAYVAVDLVIVRAADDQSVALIFSFSLVRQVYSLSGVAKVRSNCCFLCFLSVVPAGSTFFRVVLPGSFSPQSHGESSVARVVPV